MTGSPGLSSYLFPDKLKPLHNLYLNILLRNKIHQFYCDILLTQLCSSEYILDCVFRNIVYACNVHISGLISRKYDSHELRTFYLSCLPIYIFSGQSLCMP